MAFPRRSGEGGVEKCVVSESACGGNGVRVGSWRRWPDDEARGKRRNTWSGRLGAAWNGRGAVNTTKVHDRLVKDTKEGVRGVRIERVWSL